MASSHTSPASESLALADYRALLNSIDQGFCIVEVLLDANGRPDDYRFLETNAAFSQQTGLEAPLGKRIKELVPEHEQQWFEVYGRIALTGEPTRFVQEARSMDRRWFDVYAFRIGVPELRRVAVLFSDITARIRVEQSTRLLAEVSEGLLTLTRESDLSGLVRARAAAFFRLSQCAFVELDLDRHIAIVNRSWDDPSGPSVAGTHHFEDFVSESLWQEAVAGRTVVVDDVAADPRIASKERFEAFRVRSFVAIPLRRQQAWRHVMVLSRAEPSRWSDEEIEVARELAGRCWTRIERLRAELELKASEERLRLILENAREYAIFSMDLERRVTTWSEGAERLLGHRAEEITGKSADIIFTSEDLVTDAPLREARRAIDEGRAANERWHVRKDGTRFWGSGVMMSMRDDTGGVYGLLKIMRDQTDVRLAQEALVRSQTQLQDALELAQRARAEAEAAGAAKDRFLAALSHELRTPLNPVLMIAGERANDTSLPDWAREEFAMIQKNIEHEARLIDDMLDLSRITRGKLTLQQSGVNLHVVLLEVWKMVKPAAMEKAIRLDFNLASPVADLHGDPARLKQIFVNLLNNAIKFTPQHGAVDVVTRRVQDTIQIEITDTGLGMTEEELARAFEPFAQGGHELTSPGSASFGGLGLGLAIVRDLVTRHGGTVSALSLGRGRGATFLVSLPLALR